MLAVLVRLRILEMIWPRLSSFLETKSISRDELENSLSACNAAVILVSEKRSSWIAGLRTDLVSQAWLTEVVQIEDVALAEKWMKPTLGTPVVFVSPPFLTHLVESRFPLTRLASLIAAAKFHGVSLFVPLVDTASIRFSFFAILMTVLTRGAVIIQQNSIKEARRYGFPNVIGESLWTLPPSQISSYRAKVFGQTREKTFLLPSSGERRRVELAKALEPTLVASGYQIMWTSHDNLSWESYVRALGSATGALTTCWLQDTYINGPKKYQDRLPSTTVTHRVWDTFASGACLFTNNNSVFQELGFLPFEHFVPVPEFESGEHLPLIPSHDELLEIGARGRIRLLSILTHQAHYWAKLARRSGTK